MQNSQTREVENKENNPKLQSYFNSGGFSFIDLITENRLDYNNSKEENITYRVVSQDNQSHIETIIDLFKGAYGDSFPRQSVYSSRFWSQHIGKRFTSILIYVNSEAVGHIALQKDKHNPKHVELGLPAFISAQHHLANKISKFIDELCEKTAAKQGWEMLYCFIYKGCQSLHYISNTELKLEEMLLLPEYIAEDNLLETSISNQNVLIGMRCFSKQAEEKISTENNNKTILYVPKKHLKACQFLYEPIGLQRVFSSKSTSALEEALPAEGRAVEANLFSKAGVLNTFVNPSLLASNKKGRLENLVEKSAKNIRAHYVFVNMLDAACPNFCEELEENGYRFCGIFPLFRSRESIVYFKDQGSNLATDSFSTRKAKIIAHYIENYNLDTSLKLAKAEELKQSKDQTLVGQAKIAGLEISLN